MELVVERLTPSMSNQVADLIREHRATRACATLAATTDFLTGRGGKRVDGETWRMPLYHLSDRNMIIGRDLHRYMLVTVEILPRDERVATKCRLRLSVKVMLNTIRQYNNGQPTTETFTQKEAES